MSHPQPGPLQRRGPRPLLLHLMLAGLSSMSSVAASMTSKPGWPPSPLDLANPALAEALRNLLAGAGESAAGFPAAVLAETLARDSALLAGIAAYRRHPWRRDLADPPVIWAEGESRLLDYGGGGRPMLFVPSLVNRATVLDLAPGQSMVRWIADQGRRVLLLDWGWPGPVERGFDLTDYVAGRLERAVAAVGEAVVLVGYCMGGLLALGAALRRPDRVAGLALLATPWDFQAGAPERGPQAAGLLAMLEPAMALSGALPIDALQTLFALLDPWGVGDKYRRFGTMDQASARAARFVAIEDWLNDGVPLAGMMVARQSSRKRKMTPMTMMTAMPRVWMTSRIESPTTVVASKAMAYFSPGGKLLESSASAALALASTSRALALESCMTPMPMASRPAYLSEVL